MNIPQGTAAAPPSLERGAVSRQLERILQSDDFRNSSRLSSFLRFVVEETLEGRSAKIKGYSVAVSVFKRPKNFDPSEDPIVRIYAGKLRRALAYYYGHDGADDPVQIDVPKGHYVPTFSFAAPAFQTHKIIRVKRPTIVVLPLANLSSDPEQTYLADGLTDALIVTLTRSRNIEVTAEPEAADFRWSELNVRELAKSLDARFVLGGTMRQSADRIRVSAQLRDGVCGTQLWADSFERTLSADNLFAVQDEIASQVVTMVADQYEGAINRTLVGEMSYGTRSLTGYDAILRLHQYNHDASHDAFVAARRSLEEAQAADPRCAMAWAGLAELQVNGYALGYNGADRDAALSRAFASVRRAMALAPDDDYIRFVLGLTHLLARDRTSLAQVAERLIKLNRQPSVQALAAWLLALAGHWERGTAMLAERMQALNQLPGWLHHAIYLNEYLRGDYEAAYQASLKFNMPMHFWDPLERAAALGQLGRTSEAQHAIGQMLRLRPDFADHPRRYLECYILQDELVDQVIDGLRKGGCCFN